MDDIDFDLDGRPAVTSSNFVPRYPPGDPRHVISGEEAEQMKKEYIAAKLKGFTKVIEQSDFSTHDSNSDIEMGLSINETFDDAESEDEKDNETPNKESKAGEDSKQKPSFLASLSDRFSTTRSKGNGNSTGTSKTISKERKEGLDSTTSSISTTLKLPISGTKLIVVDDVPSSDEESSSEGPASAHTNMVEVPLRDIRPECPICLAEVAVGERMSWSPTEGCHHCFHEECITEWLMTLGKNVPVRLQKDLSVKFDFKMQCPVCRGDFISNDTSTSTSDE
jgi:hypothetical protein